MLDKKIQKMIDDHMQKGYSHLMKGDSISACIEWEKVWNIVVAQMDEQNYASIEDIDKEFNGRHFSVCADHSGGTVIKSKTVNGGPKRYNRF